MLCELPGGQEKYIGTNVNKASLGNTHPWSRYFNRPLEFNAMNLQQVARFLRRCRYQYDQATRSRRDYWEPPDEFEKRRRGDCEIHAIWAWRQLDALGWATRLDWSSAHLAKGTRGYIFSGTDGAMYSRRPRRFPGHPLLGHTCRTGPSSGMSLKDFSFMRIFRKIRSSYCGQLRTGAGPCRAREWDARQGRRAVPSVSAPPPVLIVGRHGMGLALHSAHAIECTARVAGAVSGESTGVPPLSGTVAAR